MIKGKKIKKGKLQTRGISRGDGVGGEKGISLRLLLLKDKIIQIKLFVNVKNKYYLKSVPTSNR